MLRFSRFQNFRAAACVGLPSVGKSALVNAISCSQQCLSADYEFTTIKPNIIKCQVFDERLVRLAAFAKSKKTLFTEVTVTDVAGLIQGASKGAGMGNTFLNDVRPSATLLHVVRCFNAPQFDAPKPLESISVIENELILADMQVVEKKITKFTTKGGKSAAVDDVAFLKRLLQHLEDGLPARTILPDAPSKTSTSTTTGTKENVSSSSSSDMDSQKKAAQVARQRLLLAELQLLSAKPTIFVANVDEASMKDGNEYSKMVEDYVRNEKVSNATSTNSKEEGDEHVKNRCVTLCALIEEQTANMDSREERLSFLSEYGVDRSQVEVLLDKVFNLNSLKTYFTVGPIQAKAWKFEDGATVREAAGIIHTDFEKFFEGAKLAHFEDFMKHPNLATADARALKPAFGPNEKMPDACCVHFEHSRPKK